MKKLLTFLWAAHSHLVPIAMILAGAFLFIYFIEDYSGILTFLWFIIVTFFYIKYNRWY